MSHGCENCAIAHHIGAGMPPKLAMLRRNGALAICSRRATGAWRLCDPSPQIGPTFLLRIVAVLDLEPSNPRLVAIVQALGDNTFQVIRAHQVEKLTAAAGDEQCL